MVPLHPTRRPIKFFVFVYLGTGRLKPVCGSVCSTQWGGPEPPVAPVLPGDRTAPHTEGRFLWVRSAAQSLPLPAPHGGRGLTTGRPPRQGRAVSRPDQRAQLEATCFKIRAHTVSETGVKHCSVLSLSVSMVLFRLDPPLSRLIPQILK